MRPSRAVPRGEGLAIRRASAYSHLLAYRRTGSERALGRFVAMVGQGGTLDCDFIVVSQLSQSERAAHLRQCCICGMRLPLTAFARDVRFAGGHRFACRTCVANDRVWHRYSQPRHAPRVKRVVEYQRTCPVCAKQFVTTDVRKFYCCNKHRLTAEKRRQRGKTREMSGVLTSIV